jgi:hypothetical protein
LPTWGRGARGAASFSSVPPTLEQADRLASDDYHVFRHHSTGLNSR